MEASSRVRSKPMEAVNGNSKSTLHRNRFEKRMRSLFLRAALVAAIAFPSTEPIAAAPFPQLLPDASAFVLTIREDPASTLPLGPACGGEASLTLACRAFIVSLKNIGAQTVRLSRISCQEPVVNFEVKEPGSSSGWWQISSISRPRCTPWTYDNLRLRPGESTVYRTRLVGPNRPPDPFAPVDPRSYTLRARWMLWGCTESPESTDCLAPLQVMKPNSWGGPQTGDVEIQTPIEVVSSAIDVASPALPDLGALKVGFEVSLAPEKEAIEARKGRSRVSCAADPGTSVECTVFHYAIRNLGDRPIRNGRFTCSDFSVMPEYRAEGGEWKSLRPQLDACTANVYFETPIMPGQAAEGDFRLSSLAPVFDTAPLNAAGRYEFRFHFQAAACFASPDGSFCLQRQRNSQP